MVNEKIAIIFSEIADMLEIMDENVFRIRAYRRAAELVRGLGRDLSEVLASEEEKIEKIPGIGKELHAKIVEIIETEECEMHKRLVNELTPGVLDILRVRGIGPKKVKLFYQELDIDTLDKLKVAAESGALATLSGMGEKSEQAVLKALEHNSFNKERIPLKVARKEADLFLKYMNECDAVDQAEVAGSLRRCVATIGDIDILVSGADAAAVSEHFVSYEKVNMVLGSGDTKSSVIIGENIQVDLRVVAPESFGAALFYFTGPKQFNIHVRTIALKQGKKVNEYGLFKGEKVLGGLTEESMFEGLGLDYLTPEERDEWK
jgi:DNA polymerase (family X)